MSYFEQVSFKDSPQLDAFSRLRVSNPTTLVDNKLTYGKSGTTFSEKLVAGATSVHDALNSCVDMGVTTSGDIAIRQTLQRFKYQSGKSQLIELTGCMEPVTGTKKAIGYFQCFTTGTNEANDGLCFEAIDDVAYVGVYKNGVSNRIAQGNWNTDTMDGNGPSGITIDWTKCQIFMIDLQWLGVGRVRFYINVDGMPIQVHEIDHANAIDNVYMRNGSQTLCYRLESTGSAGTLKQICTTVQSEGGSEQTGVVAKISGGLNPISTITTTKTAVFGVRLKSTQAVIQPSVDTEIDSIIEIVSMYMLAGSNDAVVWSLALNPVSITAGGTWSDVQGSSVQMYLGTNATTVVPSLELDGGAFSSQVRVANELNVGNLLLGTSIDGIPDEIYLCAQAASGAFNLAATGLVIRQLT